MANYREDSQETAVASDSTWGKMTTIAEEIAKTGVALLFGLTLTLSDSAVASDEISGRSYFLPVESAVISDTLFGVNHTAALVSEQGKISERYTSRIRAVVDEQATAGDHVFDQLTSLITESATATDSLPGIRYRPMPIVEQVKATDYALQFTTALASDTAQVSETLTGKLKSADLVTDSAQISESIVDVAKLDSILTDSVKILDEASGTLHAITLASDVAVIEDDPTILDGVFGQAWTANTESWGMSRYDPYSFHSVAVIDGVLYGMADTGVYALDSDQQQIAGKVVTGKLDLGKGMLAHPLGAFMEYELSGGTGKLIQVDVTTTQSGSAETYSYVMPGELSDELTNGRVQFGRGLRGRHFALTLHITGNSGFINDLNVETASTKRRT